jgi:hypothetical protein
MFRHWLKFWEDTAVSFEKKNLLAKHPAFQITGIMELYPPERVFSIVERSYFQATILYEADGWYDLPGLPEWWPDDYDFEQNGFDISDQKDRLYMARNQALKLLESKVCPPLFSQMFFEADVFAVCNS